MKYICVHCGALVTHTSYMLGFGEQMVAAQYCFMCQFWNEIWLKEKQPGMLWYQGFTTRTGQHYQLWKPGIKPHNSNLGFSGHWWMVTNLFTFEQVITNDLGGNGTVDPAWLGVFPPDAHLQSIDMPRTRKTVTERFDLKTGLPR